MRTLNYILLILFAFLCTIVKSETDFASAYGFSGMEIFPLDLGISNMTAADIDNDGLLDVILANNDKSSIQILYNQTGKTNVTSKTRRRQLELNELPPETRFDIETIPSDTKITSLVVEDINNDGKKDIIYYGDSHELIILQNKGNRDWESPLRWPIKDGLTVKRALAVADINNDKLPDIILLGESCFYILYQMKDNKLADPERFSCSGTPSMLEVRDFNSDKLNDLLLVAWDSKTPFILRFQTANGMLGPEIPIESLPIRSYHIDDIDGDGLNEFIIMPLKTDRAEIGRISFKQRSEKSDIVTSQFSIIPLQKTSKSKRGLACLDINADKTPEIIVANPENGSIAVISKGQNALFSKVDNFPSFTGVSDITVADWDSDGTPEIFVLSSDEKQIGVTRMQNGKLGFPQNIQIDGKPLIICSGKLDPAGKPVLLAITETEKGRLLWIIKNDGSRKTQPLDKSFQSTPSKMFILDIDQDQQPDIIISVPYEKLRILRQTKPEEFEELTLELPGGSAESSNLDFGDIDNDGKPELLVCQRNFVRAITLTNKMTATNSSASNLWTFNVKEQINGLSSNSRILSARIIDLSKPEKQQYLCLFDSGEKVLSFCSRDKNGLWRLQANKRLQFTDFYTLVPITTSYSNTDQILLVGMNSVGLIDPDTPAANWEHLAYYESPKKNGYLNDITTTNLSKTNKYKDLIFIETSKNSLEIVSMTKPWDLVLATGWRIFEQRQFSSRAINYSNEPREILCGDFTGDDKIDIVIMVHDRLILYPQE